VPLRQVIPQERVAPTGGRSIQGNEAVTDRQSQTTKRQREFIIAAATARTDLNIFEAVVRLVEGGMVGSDCYRAAERIVSISRAEQQKCLRRYDAALMKAGGGAYGE
jgi:hypothetical protein